MTITTPEQMREAAMDAVEDYCSDMPDLAGHGHSIGLKDAIRAIPIAPQPVAVTVKQQLAKHRETFCLASPGNEAAFHAYLAGFDDAAAISASQLPAAVAVLPLVWELSNARSVAGTYTFGRIGGEWWVRLKDCEIAEGHEPDFELAEEAAKAAAQADYEARILSALTIQPADTQQPVALGPDDGLDAMREEFQFPDDVIELAKRIGRAEWGATEPKPAEDHGADMVHTVKKTAAHFGQIDQQAMHGLYIDGTGIVICHTGVSPNSPEIARVLTGLWNMLCDAASIATTLSPTAVDNSPALILARKDKIND